MVCAVLASSFARFAAFAVKTTNAKGTSPPGKFELEREGLNQGINAYYSHLEPRRHRHSKHQDDLTSSLRAQRERPGNLSPKIIVRVEVNTLAHNLLSLSPMRVTPG